MTIERNFNIPFIAAHALREKQIQQNYRPIIAVHKWFARRPGTLFRGLLLSEFGEGPIADRFYKSNQLPGLRIADPFMGGGTPLIEANRLGCDVEGFDINPMAYWIVGEELEHLDLDAYKARSEKLLEWLEEEVGDLYRTTCTECGAEAPVKYFLWIKTHQCRHCREKFDLFPGYQVAKARRHPRHVLICAKCGDLAEVEDLKHPGACSGCDADLLVHGPARRNRCSCPHCGKDNRYPDSESGTPSHRLFAIEYHCHYCKPNHKGRFFKKASPDDLAKFGEAESKWKRSRSRFVPQDEIPSGDETDRLHRWGYRRYHEMFNSRQLLGLELSARFISRQRNKRIRDALATNLSDLLRYQNMLCRYDTMALKSLDIFSVHGFPVGLVQCESNLLGNRNGNRVCVGSGGWTNIINKYAKAKAYCDHPFETRYQGKKKVVVPTPGEWVGEERNGEQREVSLHCQSATVANLPAHSLDAVLTDPPYFGNVQYAELMDFCYVWLRKLAGKDRPGFTEISTRNPDELTGNETLSRGLDHFTEGLSAVYCRMAHALKKGRPMAFTYHHNQLDAYAPIVVAILDAGLTCTATIPCPAEMSASIHISGTGSSVIDTVFVCRELDIPKGHETTSPDDLLALLIEDVGKLKESGMQISAGDLRCIAFGHVARLAIQALKSKWNLDVPALEKLHLVTKWSAPWKDFISSTTLSENSLLRRKREQQKGQIVVHETAI